MDQAEPAQPGILSLVPLFGVIVALLAPLGPIILGVLLANRNAKKARAEVATATLAMEESSRKNTAEITKVQEVMDQGLEHALNKIEALEQSVFDPDLRALPIRKPDNLPYDDT